MRRAGGRAGGSFFTSCLKELAANLSPGFCLCLRDDNVRVYCTTSPVTPAPQSTPPPTPRLPYSRLSADVFAFNRNHTNAVFFFPPYSQASITARCCFGHNKIFQPSGWRLDSTFVIKKKEKKSRFKTYTIKVTRSAGVGEQCLCQLQFERAWKWRPRRPSKILRLTPSSSSEPRRLYAAPTVHAWSDEETAPQYQAVTFEPTGKKLKKKKTTAGAFAQIVGVNTEADVISGRLHRVSRRWIPVFQVSALKSTTSAFVYFQ